MAVTNLIVLIILFGNIPFSNKVVINKIKILGANYTKKRIIRNFITEFDEGDTVDERKLRSAVQRIKKRLLKTTWFYNVEVFTVHSRKCEICRNVIVELNEGFRYRFWGGKVFAGFGIENLSGKGRYLGVELGVNRQIVYYDDKFINFSKFFCSIEVGNKGVEYVDSQTNYLKIEEGQKIGFNSFIGYHLPNDLDVGLTVNTGALETKHYKFLCKFAFVGLKGVIDRRNNIFSATKGIFSTVSTNYDVHNNVGKIEADLRGYTSLIKNLSLAFRGHLGLQKAKSDFKYFYYHLDGIDGVRSSDGDSLISKNVADLHGELRFNIYTFSVWGIFTIGQKGVLFFDIGDEISKDSKIFQNPAYAYGVGLRFYFDNPVFLPIRFEIGFNRKGEVSYFFSTTRPF